MPVTMLTARNLRCTLLLECARHALNERSIASSVKSVSKQDRRTPSLRKVISGKSTIRIKGAGNDDHILSGEEILHQSSHSKKQQSLTNQRQQQQKSTPSSRSPQHANASNSKLFPESHARSRAREAPDRRSSTSTSSETPSGGRGRLAVKSRPLYAKRTQTLNNDHRHHPLYSTTTAKSTTAKSTPPPPQSHRFYNNHRLKWMKPGQLIHPSDLIDIKVPGTYRMTGSKLARYADTLRPTVFPEGDNSKTLEELLREQEKQASLSERKALMQNNAVYINPICKHIDQQLLSFNSIDQILSHTISHRGVYYVHNLITAVQLIAILSSNSSTVELCSLDDDDRFHLLISDLKENRRSLDIVALANVLVSLQRLGIRNYLVFNAFLEPLLDMEMKVDSMRDVMHVIRVAQLYRWCGYSDGALYDKVTQAMERGRLFLTKDLLVEGLRVVGSLKSQHHRGFFKTGELVGRMWEGQNSFYRVKIRCPRIWELRWLFIIRMYSTPNVILQHIGFSLGFIGHTGRKLQWVIKEK